MSKYALDFWFDFASTYSYIAAMRIAWLAEKAGVDVRWRPFLLGPIFQSQGLQGSPFNVFPVKGKYMWRDMQRCCAGIGVPFVRLDIFPQSSVLAARVALIGLQDGWGEEFCRAVFRAEFAEGLTISDRPVIEGILVRIGIDPAQTMARAQSDANKAALRRETEEAVQLEIFGAPTFVTADKELFWGNDRLEQAIQWATTKAA